MRYLIYKSSSLFVINVLIYISAFAQTGYTTRYIYDNKGQLRAVITQNGEAAVYDYDPAGNFTAIRRLTPTDFEIIEFTPRSGAVGSNVTIYGVGLNEEVSNVTFNGLSGQIISQTKTSVIAKVPVNAISGPISVTTPRGSRTTSSSFIVKGIRVIPEAVTISSNGTMQFAANVTDDYDNDLIWSVNSFVGGNNTVGTISENGLYQAPDLSSLPTTQYIIRATSGYDSSFYGESQVTVLGQSSGNQFLTKGISVSYGSPLNIASTYIPSKPISVRYASQQNIISAPIQAAVSATLGPIIASISPATMPIGSNIVITINGNNLSGTSNLRFINTNGTVEDKITASNITINNDGTSLSATVNVNTLTVPGRRTIHVKAIRGNSPLNDLGSNSIEILP